MYNDKYIQYAENGNLILPNIKQIFLPDEGKEIADVDLSGADIMVVAADSYCKWLLDFFSKPQPKKVYAQIASEYFQRDISDKSDEYKLYKAVFHGTNYKLGIKKLAGMAGLSLLQAQGLQDFYFHLNPEVKQWHLRLESNVKKYGYVTNIFGRRMEFLNLRNPNLMNEVCASIPQSTIGDVINQAWIQIDENIPEVEVLMQVHDSLVLQYDIIKPIEPYYELDKYGNLFYFDQTESIRERILESMVVDIPYNPILHIESDIKVSRSSYGETKKVKK
jgi:DNA polymerase I-like protein with 3'-5' exonuclease and polymerase domains